MSPGIHKATHLDHGITDAHLEYILNSLDGRDGFFIATLTLHRGLASLPCALHGPAVGEAPVREEEVTYARRGTREWPSRLVDRPAGESRTVTVIAGPYEQHACVIYTAYGGPLAPREPGDPGLKTDAERAEAAAFWAEHALSP